MPSDNSQTEKKTKWQGNCEDHQSNTCQLNPLKRPAKYIGTPVLAATVCLYIHLSHLLLPNYHIIKPPTQASYSFKALPSQLWLPVVSRR